MPGAFRRALTTGGDAFNGSQLTLLDKLFIFEPVLRLSTADTYGSVPGWLSLVFFCINE
jgi:hypothetical protein